MLKRKSIKKNKKAIRRKMRRITKNSSMPANWHIVKIAGWKASSHYVYRDHNSGSLKFD